MSVVRKTELEMTSQKVQDSGKEDKVHLRRRISLVPAVSFIIGSMVGSGIFIAPKGVHINTGSVGLSLVVWVLCGLLSMLGYVYMHDQIAVLGVISTIPVWNFYHHMSI
ncbi:cystine/glutamate transporter [Tachysurus ichikawai]